MSRIFKSTHVNVGRPLEVIMNEKEVMHSRKKVLERERSSDLNGNDPNATASSIIERAHIEANEIIEAINEQAQQTLSIARIEAETIKTNMVQQGYQEGYQQGYQKGLDDGRMETEDLAHEALSIKEEVEAERASLISSMESQVVDIIIQAVRKIIDTEMKTNREIILNVISNALRKINSNGVVVKISEEDFQVVNDNMNEILSNSKGISEIEIKKDLSLDAGDCILETKFGDIDASVNTQVDSLANIIETMGNDDDE